MTDTHLWATLRARDAAAEIDFLVAALGFVELVRYSGGDDRIAHAELAWPLGGGVMLGSAGDRGPDDAWPAQPGTAATYVHTLDADALFARATAAGATVVQPLGDSDHGSRQFAVRDPEGNLWSVGTYAGHGS